MRWLIWLVVGLAVFLLPSHTQARVVPPIVAVYSDNCFFDCLGADLPTADGGGNYSTDCNVSIHENTHFKGSIGVDLIGQNITLRNCRIHNYYYCITAFTSNNTILNNTVSSCGAYGGGYAISAGSYANISYNNFSSNTVGIDSPSLSYIYNNTFSDNGNAVKLSSYVNIFRNNVFTNNGNDFSFYGEGYSQDVDTSNIIDNKTVYWLTEAKDALLDGNNVAEALVICSLCTNFTAINLNISDVGYGVVFYNTSNSKVENSSFSNTGQGIVFYNTLNSRIENNSFSNIYQGIRLVSSSNNTMIGNNISQNSDSGISVLSSYYNNFSENRIIANVPSNVNNGFYIRSSNHNTFSNNNVSVLDEGFDIYESSNNTLSENVIYSNRGLAGIEIGCYSYNNTIKDNMIYNNSNGILMWSISCEDSVNYNHVLGNIIYNNQDEGIDLFDASFNVVSNNTIYSNTGGITIMGSSNNTLSLNRLFNNYEGMWVTIESYYNNISYNNFTNNSGGISINQDSHGNTLIGNRITNSTFGCIAFGGGWPYPDATNNSVIDSVLSNCGAIAISSTGWANNTIINSTFDKDNVSFGDSNSSLTVKWYLTVEVLDGNGNPQDGTTLLISDLFGNQEVSGITDLDGVSQHFALTEYVQTLENKTYYTPHTITFRKWLSENSTTVYVNESKKVTLLLDAVAPVHRYQMDVEANWSFTNQTVTVKILGRDGKPLSRADVGVYLEGHRILDLESDEDGIVEFTPTREGEYKIEVEKTRYKDEEITIEVRNPIVTTTTSILITTTTITQETAVTSTTTTNIKSTTTTSSLTSTSSSTTTSIDRELAQVRVERKKTLNLFWVILGVLIFLIILLMLLFVRIRGSKRKTLRGV